MTKSHEQYQPTSEEMEKAEETMTEKEKVASEFRKSVMERGEFCGMGIVGQIKALELAKEGKGHPANIDNLYVMGMPEGRAWVLVNKKDMEGLGSFGSWQSEKKWNPDLLAGKGNWDTDWEKPHYSIYYGTDMSKTPKRYEKHLNELKDRIQDIQEMFDFAKKNGKLIESGGGMSRIQVGNSYIAEKENEIYVVDEEGYERIYNSLDELTEAIGAERITEPSDDGQPGTVHWGEGWQGGIGGGVVIVEVNGKEYYRQI